MQTALKFAFTICYFVILQSKQQIIIIKHINKMNINGLITIVKGEKYKFNSPVSMQDGNIYEVTRTGANKTTLNPEYLSLSNPSFNININDFKLAIALNYYTLITN